MWDRVMSLITTGFVIYYNIACNFSVQIYSNYDQKAAEFMTSFNEYDTDNNYWVTPDYKQSGRIQAFPTHYLSHYPQHQLFYLRG